jgi:aspartate/methionine/tyrosine aminotransferase
MRQFPASPITALVDESPRYNLGESFGPHLSVADVLDPGDLAQLARLSLGYGTSAGDAALRAQIAGRHGVAEDQVLITAGAASALFLLTLVCGDGEIVAGLPAYPPMLDALRGVGAQVVTVRSRFCDGYRVNLDEFRAALSVRTRLIMFASPQNPSGVALTRGEVAEMLAAASSRCPEAIVLIDETFREATFGTAPVSTFAGMSPRVVTCGSVSKAYGAPGLRIGWLTVAEPRLREQLRLAKFNSSISCGVLDEFLAARLLSRADQVLASRGAAMTEARAIVERWVGEHADQLRWLRPEAGAFCCVQLDPDTFGPSAIRRFHDRLAEQQTMVAPGPWFGDSAQVMRLGFAYEPPGQLEKGLAVITDALAGC